MKSSNQTEEIVTNQFSNQVELYSQHDEKVDSPVLPFLKKTLPKFKTGQSIKIGEFGGGGGDLLRAINNLTKRTLTLHNIELVGAYKNHQADKSIKFVKQSLLDSDIADNTYDIVIVRNVIHHLINPWHFQTRMNQSHAIHELVRVTKPGGYILIDEQVNNSKIACMLYFYLSWIATKMKLNIPAFQITESTIVGYLQRQELQAIASTVVPRKFWEANTFFRWEPQLHWKLTGLMNDTGSAFIAMKKP